MGIGLPGVFTKVSELTPAGAPPAVGLVVVGQGLGGILGPFGFQIVQNIFNQDIGRFPLAVSAIGLVVLASNLGNRRKETNKRYRGNFKSLNNKRVLQRNFCNILFLF